LDEEFLAIAGEDKCVSLEELLKEFGVEPTAPAAPTEV